MDQKVIVGLTGGIGSGKSYVCELLRTHEVPVYDSDFQAKLLMNEDSTMRTRIQELLGEEAYSEGKLNRAFVAQRVFGDRDLLESLNAIVHPAVREHFRSWARASHSRVVVQETALIFEQGMESHYDRIVLVTAPLSLRLHRVSLRDHTDPAQVMDRVRHQLPESAQLPRADYCIRNILRSDTVQQVRTMALHLKYLRI